MHLRSGSGFSSELIQDHAESGLPVDFFARIIKVEDTIPTELKSQFAIFEQVYERNMGTKAS